MTRDEDSDLSAADVREDPEEASEGEDKQLGE
jgi:hypothetical protein